MVVCDWPMDGRVPDPDADVELCAHQAVGVANGGAEWPGPLLFDVLVCAKHAQAALDAGCAVYRPLGSTFLTVHQETPMSTAPRPLPRGYASRPGVASVFVLGAAVGVTAAFWGWCWARDVVRGIVGPY